MTIQNNRRDITTNIGNPANGLQAEYQRLMAIDDRQALAQAALNIVKPYVNKGMSDTNYQKFVANLKDSARKGTDGIKRFISNFILSASGMAVGEDVRLGIASFINEDTNPVRLSPKQLALKNLVENNTKFSVVLKEYDGMPVHVDQEKPVDRNALTAKARKLMESGECACWSDLYDMMSNEIKATARSINKDTGYVIACLIDDIEDTM